MHKEPILSEMSLFKELGLCIHSAIYLDTDTAGLFNSDRILHNKALNYFY